MKFRSEEEIKSELKTLWQDITSNDSLLHNNALSRFKGIGWTLGFGIIFDVKKWAGIEDAE